MLRNLALLSGCQSSDFVLWRGRSATRNSAPEGEGQTVSRDSNSGRGFGRPSWATVSETCWTATQRQQQHQRPIVSNSISNPTSATTSATQRQLQHQQPN